MPTFERDTVRRGTRFPVVMGARLALLVSIVVATLAVAASPGLAQAQDPPAPGRGPTDGREVEAFVDGVIEQQLEGYEIPGATVSVVKDGEVLFAKGYGQADVEVDAGGRAVVPGFVDSHSHLVFAGDRSEEFAARMAGESYAAGGIRTTVAATRASGSMRRRPLARPRRAPRRSPSASRICSAGCRYRSQFPGADW